VNGVSFYDVIKSYSAVTRDVGTSHTAASLWHSRQQMREPHSVTSASSLFMCVQHHRKPKLASFWSRLRPTAVYFKLRPIHVYVFALTASPCLTQRDAKQPKHWQLVTHNARVASLDHLGDAGWGH